MKHTVDDTKIQFAKSDLLAIWLQSNLLNNRNNPFGKIQKIVATLIQKPLGIPVYVQKTFNATRKN